MGANDLYISKRRNPRDDFSWDIPENLGPNLNSPADDYTPGWLDDEVTSTNTLYFGSTRPGGMGAIDIYTSVLRNDGTFGPAAPVPELNTSGADWWPRPRRDGLEMFFSSDRTGTVGSHDLWVSSRESIADRWSPPVNMGPLINSTAQESGNTISYDGTSLIFYSNRPGGQGGQELYEITRAKVPTFTPECAVTGTPAISAVVNSGSFQAAVAANAMVSIFGSGFAPQGTGRAVGRMGLNETRFPTELACVALEVAGLRAPVTFVSPTQINAQLPSLTITGPVEIRVILNPGRSNEIRGAAQSVPIQARAPAFFTFTGSTIAAQHNDFAPLADPGVVATGRPARPGDLVILYGTGFGLTVPAFQAGEIADRTALLRDTITVTVGGAALRPENILYAGLAPGSISGLYQFNVRIPETVQVGNIPVVIEVGGARTQAGLTIPVR
ncbi:MAG: hypothetical protein A3J28_11870 [Acidobacteria bacterium RIFCSPLOWO2_12_FULL_60_22]|nr:MAG: hypothetical protein A3J28_11870 [Acidobacteria bacterium RIFCSPLOWO2_12_FULL_60_22]